ncbi:ROK family protein [Thiomicrorhabdus sp. ZW0627]|uniref:ROK family protein n=1 Tax=Thiomicrorhabdus sp. ZW0627 TaxID=3039774 RepID=UPI002436BF12|nr:ROK family protein [Thiomicrorhabdus sp. ZW0627]MDG6772742.1 ROK family protein [Thiomicrorhabdus sp. ZW0627]
MRLGVDLGGTKIEIIALDEAGESLYRKRVDTPKGDYAATLNAIVGLVKGAETELGQKGSLGIGIPGAVSRKTGRIKNANSTWLIGQDLSGDLQQRLDREIRLANDANCFALSEATDGAGKGAEVVFGVIIGTGCGGGVVVNGRIINGINSIGGEWGHNPLPWASADDVQMDCYCGLKGCNETFLSGSGLQVHYQKRTGLFKTAKEIVALSERGDAVAEQIMQDYTLWLAKGLASVINVLDPDVIVLGGGMSNIQRLYSDVPELWGDWVFSDLVDTRLVPPVYGDSSGVRGAAWL